MNKLCRFCLNDCKQSERAKIIECRRYHPAPVQLELKFKNKKTAPVRSGVKR